MIGLGRHPLAAAVSIAFAGAMLFCATPRALTPKVGPGTDYPCGFHTADGGVNVKGVSCGGVECCDEGTVCGGTAFSGCPAGECCFVGDDGLLAARRPVPQWRAGTR